MRLSMQETEADGPSRGRATLQQQSMCDQVRRLPTPGFGIARRGLRARRSSDATCGPFLANSRLTEGSLKYIHLFGKQRSSHHG